jgi:hypothetical protein
MMVAWAAPAANIRIAAAAVIAFKFIETSPLDAATKSAAWRPVRRTPLYITL